MKLPELKQQVKLNKQLRWKEKFEEKERMYNNLWYNYMCLRTAVIECSDDVMEILDEQAEIYGLKHGE